MTRLALAALAPGGPLPIIQPLFPTSCNNSETATLAKPLHHSALLVSHGVRLWQAEPGLSAGSCSGKTNYKQEALTACGQARHA